jgi:hypothetical protein
MSAARPTRTTPLVKQEETAADTENLLLLGYDVSEADVELLLNFRRDGAQGMCWPSMVHGALANLYPL